MNPAERALAAKRIRERCRQQEPIEPGELVLVPEDIYIIFAALAAMVEDIHAPQDNLTASQWDRAEALWATVQEMVDGR
jgi:hypothetical protein